ncbi:tyrosine-type recombinase/integrase [Sandaracinus amylolyticus]|uniref:tyrosine-type recombinase/integrase n=1 Tax=Sandaracinus amylolyticus TaxID=927083 RepID=UPI001F3A160F|nr:site-specific integrase [Sandaracinus amylolyticus]UJR83634.1 Hypothetical protein I5071_57030 [Sandaracinus amylolyticus]
MPVRSVMRRGKRRLFVDIRYTNREGKLDRFRRDAEVQTLAAARAEERRRLALIASTGSPYEPTELLAIARISHGESAGNPGSTIDVAKLFRDVVKDYLASFAPSQLKPSTRAGYEKALRKHLLPSLGELRVDQIDARRVRAIDSEMVRAGSKASTRRNVQAVLRSILCRYCVEAGMLDVPPALPRMPRVGVSIQHAMSVQDLRALLAAATPAERVAISLAAFAGLRAGEVRGLQWRDVDLDAARLVVRRAVSSGVEAPPKSGHERVVPLTPELVDVLRGAGPRDRSARVSLGPKGTPWTEHSLGAAFRRAQRRAGLEGWRFHDLRHFFVTHLFRAKAAAPAVQRLAGHLHLSTTQRYAHVAAIDLESAVAALAATTS